MNLIESDYNLALFYFHTILLVSIIKWRTLLILL